MEQVSADLAIIVEEAESLLRRVSEEESGKPCCTAVGRASKSSDT
jgi:hypothetical protein